MFFYLLWIIYLDSTQRTQIKLVGTKKRCKINILISFVRTCFQIFPRTQSSVYLFCCADTVVVYEKRKNGKQGRIVNLEYLFLELGYVSRAGAFIQLWKTNLLSWPWLALLRNLQRIRDQLQRKNTFAVFYLNINNAWWLTYDFSSIFSFYLLLIYYS